MYQKIFRNTSYLIFAQVLIKVISFFYAIFLARSLNVEIFGLYTVALSYFSLIAALSDFGVSRFLIREVAKDKQNLPLLFLNTVFVRLTTVCVVFGLFGLFLPMLDQDKLRVGFTLLAVMAVLPQSLVVTVENIFIALQRASISAFGSIVLSLATTIAGYYLVSNSFSPFAVIFAIIIGQLIEALFLAIVLFRQKISFWGKIKTKVILELVKGSIPYGLLGVMGLVYFKVDSIILSYIKGSYETGIYGLAYKFLEATLFIPTALSMAIFPVLTKLHQGDLSQLRKIFFDILKVMGGLGLVLILVFNLILPEFIRLVLPDKYFPSIPAIRILSLSLPFLFIHVPLSQILLSTDKFLKQVIIMSLIPLSFNVISNLIFIPRFGLYAAAWITVFSDIISFAWIALFLQKVYLRKV